MRLADRVTISPNRGVVVRFGAIFSPLQTSIGRLGGVLLVLLLGSFREVVAAELEVRTESVHVQFDPQGGVPVLWEIVDERYDASADVDEPERRGITLFDASLIPGSDRPLAIELAGSASQTGFFSTAVYEVKQRETAEAVTIAFTSPASPHGVVLRKTYTLPRRGFAVRFELAWHSTRDQAEDLGHLTMALGPAIGPPARVDVGLAGSLYAYTDVVVATGDDVFAETLDADNTDLKWSGEPDPIGWSGVHSRYFLMALASVPGTNTSIAAVRASLAPPLAGDSDNVAGPRVQLQIPMGELSSGRDSRQEFVLYVGPKERSALREANADLDRVLYLSLWGWLRWLCIGLMSVLGALHGIVPSWGTAIILLAVLVRLVLYPLAQSGLRAQAKVNADNARVRPHLERIKLEYKNDAVRRHEETMKVYKEHGVNPYAAFKGCGWLIVQLPIFVALFNVIGQAYELRGVDFLWIDNLAAPDRLFELGFTIPFLGSSFNLLPVLMAATQVLVSNLSPAPGADLRQQRSQHRMMLAMAVAFFVLFYNFPAGLVLYWTCSNLGHLFQQHMVNRSLPQRSTSA